MSRLRYARTMCERLIGKLDSKSVATVNAVKSEVLPMTIWTSTNYCTIVIYLEHAMLVHLPERITSFIVCFFVCFFVCSYVMDTTIILRNATGITAIAQECQKLTTQLLCPFFFFFIVRHFAYKNYHHICTVYAPHYICTLIVINSCFEVLNVMLLVFYILHVGNTLGVLKQ